MDLWSWPPLIHRARHQTFWNSTRSFYWMSFQHIHSIISLLYPAFHHVKTKQILNLHEWPDILIFLETWAPIRYKDVILPNIGIPIMEIRRSCDRLISIMVTSWHGYAVHIAGPWWRESIVHQWPVTAIIIRDKTVMINPVYLIRRR